jgi:alpha-L-rhamnosidase
MADTRYNVWLNGAWVGYGPNRSFPDRAYYDEYDATALWRDGDNEVRVLVHATGIATFQNLESRAGLWAEVEADGEVVARTDASWECRRDARFSSRRFRISCQQGWQEMLVPATDEPWVRAVAVEDDRIPQPAPVRLAVSRVVEPAGVVEAATVQPPRAVLSVALREILLPGFTGAAPKQIWGAVGLMFHVKHSQPLHLDLPGSWFWVRPKGFLNGDAMREVPSRNSRFENGIGLEAEAQAGENFLALDVSGFFHEWHLTASLPEVQIDGEPKVLVAGPFASHEEVAPLLVAPPSAWLRHERVQEPPEEVLAPLSRGAPFPMTAYAKPVKTLQVSDTKETRLGPRETRVILDLGAMTVGFWEYEIEADEPGILRLNGFEAYQEGEPDFCWEMSNTIEHEYPAGVTRHRSPIRRGARYIVVQGSNATVRNFRVHEHTAALSEAKFECSDDVLNRIWEMCARTARLCAEDTFVDCPTYEQTFWVGDARNEAHVLAAVFGDWSIARRCWLLAAESLRQGEFVMSHVPSGWPMVIPAWSFLWAIGCWEYFEATEDLVFLQSVVPALEQQMAAVERHLDENDLFSIEAWNLCEWSEMDQPGIGVVTHNQGWAAMALECTANALIALGDERAANRARACRERIAEAVNRRLWCEKRRAYSDCIKHDTGLLSDTFSVQTQVVLYLAGLVPPDRLPRVEALIAGEAETANEFVQVGTPFFLFFVFEALERMGRHDLIFKRIRETWGMMLDRGATTCWELLPGFMPAGRWTRSHCHAWSAGPAYFLSRLVLGIQPVAPGMREFRFSPAEASGVEWARGEVPTPHGSIRVEWERRDGQLSSTVLTPKGVNVAQ